MIDVDIFVDPVCPYAWMTSQWMLQVENVRNVHTRFNIMSLSVLNENRDDIAEDYKAGISRWWKPVRVAMAVERDHGKDGLRAFYLAAGTLHHNDDKEFTREVIEKALANAGLNPALADAMDDTSLDDAVRASHTEAMSGMTNDVGTPIIRFPKADGDTTAYFGPIFTPPPTGEQAGALWDAMVTIASTPGVFELKRSRNVDPKFLPMEGVS